MPQFLVELYLPRSTPSAARQHAVRARRAAVELSRAGTAVRYLRSIFVPDEETCFYLYEAATAADVRAAAQLAQLPVHNVVEAISSDGEP
jgi:hypothetical protein